MTLVEQYMCLSRGYRLVLTDVVQNEYEGLDGVKYGIPLKSFRIAVSFLRVYSFKNVFSCLEYLLQIHKGVIIYK